MKTLFIVGLLFSFSSVAICKEVETYKVQNELSGTTDINIICSEVNGSINFKTVTKAIKLEAVNQISGESLSKEIVFRSNGLNIIAGVSTVVGEMEREPSLDEIESAKKQCLKKIAEFKKEIPGLVIYSSLIPITKNTKYKMISSLEIEKRVGDYTECTGYTDDISFHEELFDLTGTKSNLTGFSLYVNGENVDLFEVRRNKALECQTVKSVIGGSFYSIINLGGTIAPLAQKTLRMILGIE